MELSPGPGSGGLYNQPGVVSGLSEADSLQLLAFARNIQGDLVFLCKAE